MRRFCIEWNAYRIEFDTDYGADHRSGWSASRRGSYVAQLTTLRAAVSALWVAANDEPLTRSDEAE